MSFDYQSVNALPHTIKTIYNRLHQADRNPVCMVQYWNRSMKALCVPCHGESGTQ